MILEPKNDLVSRIGHMGETSGKNPASGKKEQSQDRIRVDLTPDHCYYTRIHHFQFSIMGLKPEKERGSVKNFRIL